MTSAASQLRPDVVRAFAGRDFAIARSYRLPFILDAFFGVLQLAVYFFISRTLPEAGAKLGGAPSYFAFAAVGLIVAVVVQAASEELAYQIRNQQLSGTLEVIVAQPLSVAELCSGLVAFPFVFALARAAVYLAIAAGWMKLDVANTSWVGLVAVFVVSAVALSAIGLLAGALVIVLKRGEALASMAVFAMTLLGGSVFPISALPGWLEPLGKILPLRFAYDGVRAALFRGEGWGVDVLVLLGFSVVMVPLAVWIFGRALRFAARQGSLGQY
ncbi:MAG: ABC transporter permease [Gaiellaceae bacterium]